MRHDSKIGNLAENPIFDLFLNPFTSKNSERDFTSVELRGVVKTLKSPETHADI